MIVYTFKANVNFFIFVDKFKTVYDTITQQIIEQLNSCNWPVSENMFIDMSTGEQYWVTEREWPSLDFFLKVVDIIANNFTDDMVAYLENNDVIRYIQIVDDLGNTILHETKLPNIYGQAYIDWINNILAQQQALGCVNV